MAEPLKLQLSKRIFNDAFYPLLFFFIGRRRNMKFCEQGDCEYDDRGGMCCKCCDLKDECEYACWRCDDDDECIYEIDGD